MATKTLLCLLTAAFFSTFQEVAGLDLIDKLLGKDHDYYAEGLNKRQNIFFDQVWKEEFRHRSSQFLLPDSLLTVCFVLVVSYMFYIVIALCMKSELKIQTVNTDDEALKALLGNHQFKDSIIPSKIKSAYEIGSGVVVDTPIEKIPLLDGDLEPEVADEVKVHRQCTGKNGLDNRAVTL